ncbi:MAG: enoyl-CoA hydratase-related protein [Deinococcales bacterium]
MRIMAKDAFMNTAFTRIGLTMAAGGSFFLPRLVGRGRALELNYTARKISAEEAAHLGLAEMIFPTEVFEHEVLNFGAKLAQGATAAFGHLKACVDASFTNTLSQHLALEGEHQQAAGKSYDFKEGVAAFLEKRPAHFQGK